MKRIIKSFLLIIILSLFIVPPANAAEATLFLSPGSGNYTIGKSFNVKVMVNSGGGVGINAAEGVISYDPAILLVSGVSETGRGTLWWG